MKSQAKVFHFVILTISQSLTKFCEFYKFFENRISKNIYKFIIINMPHAIYWVYFATKKLLLVYIVN